MRKIGRGTNPSLLVHYRLAMEAEPRLKAIESVVRMLLVHSWPPDRAWSLVVRPLAEPFVGRLRGIGISGAENPLPPDLSESERRQIRKKILDNLDGETELLITCRVPALTVTEEWLRTSDAWDAVTSVWRSSLQEAFLQAEPK